MPKAITTNDRRRISANSTTLNKDKEMKQAPSLQGNIAKKLTTSRETRTSERMTNTDDSKVKYDAFSRAPFIVYFRLVKNNEGKQLSLQRILNMLNSANIKFSYIERYSRIIWKVTFSSKTMANNAISNKMLSDVGLIAFIPKFKVSRKVVIREIPENFLLDELKEVIEDENTNLVVLNIFRLKRRDRETRKLKDSQTVCIELRGEVLPEKIYIYKTVNVVIPYISSVRFCYKCGLIGHISEYCEKPETCLTCAGSHSFSRESPCLLTKKCINCKGPHSSLDRSCPKYKKHAEIAMVMAYNNLPFLEARKLVETNGSSPLSTVKSLRKYPTLPSESSDVFGAHPPSECSRIPGPHLFKEALQGEMKSDLELPLQSILEAIMAAPDADILCDRIKKTIDLHLSIGNSKRKN